MPLAELRKHYGLGALKRADFHADPIKQFESWFDQAQAAVGTGSRLRRIAVGFYKWWQIVLGRRSSEPNAMTLATADKQGRPSARMVLLKGVDERGFSFFTNYESRKGRELDENPQATLVFHWSELERQVCVSGSVKKLSVEESAAYFKSRPKGSRLAAWASRQSEPVATREMLEQSFAEAVARFPGDDVPLPPNWGGYVLRPERIEFWQGRPDRLHDRFCYRRVGDRQWELTRLSP